METSPYKADPTICHFSKNEIVYVPIGSVSRDASNEHLDKVPFEKKMSKVIITLRKVTSLLRKVSVLNTFRKSEQKSQFSVITDHQ